MKSTGIKEHLKTDRISGLHGIGFIPGRQALILRKENMYAGDQPDPDPGGKRAGAA